ncbi:hypothetical protein [Psychrobacter sp. FDAARGOS_221]|uniref:hypothetical protein n=1 Tax=Psychrobacter sp. FDAARGOS_221 TaxID=1975705 RepID=UPI000BB579C0|nr:hypothetical protein [Psychrobacter sp. FDAARGOS_221]PNK59894.1 hypothetical protein A6J60_002715 [Psychrobacter sp. FDAARGOS_221]
MGLFDGLNPVYQTANTHAKILKQNFGHNWSELENNLPIVLATMIEQRDPLKKRFPLEHQQFVQNCLNGKFRNLSDFILEIIRIEFYHKHGYIPAGEADIHLAKIHKALRKHNLPERLISGYI